MYDAFTCTLRFADGSYAVFSQCLAGFEHSLVLELAGDQRRDPHLVGRRHGPHGRRRTSSSSCSAPAPRQAEIVAVEKSGEVFELEEQLRRLLVDVPRARPLVSAREALPSQIVCLEIERALAERRAIPLRWP